MSNQQSVKARSSPTETWIALGTLVATYNFAASPFLHCMISTPETCQSCDSYAAAFAAIWAKQQTQLGRTLVARWQYNFNSGTFASGKTRMAPKTNKFTAAWRLAPKLTDAPLFMKCQINNQLKPDFPQHKPGSPWENWSLPTTSQLHLFCTAWSLPGKRCAKTKNKNHQWRSAARVSASRCTNPWYMTHPVLPFTIREPRHFCLNCAGLWLWVVWGFRTVQIPLAGRHWYSRAQHSRINYQNLGQEITSKTNTEPPKCHWLPATGFQRVQNPDPNQIHNAS